MLDVMIGLTPVLLCALWAFRWFAVYQIGLCVLTCLVTEWGFARMRGRRASLDDCSALITGVILGLSLPWSAPWQVPVFGSVLAIGLGKMAYGGLGFNIFNPAMVGRAFVMLSFATAMGSGAYLVSDAQNAPAIVTQATPMTLLKSGPGAYVQAEKSEAAMRTRFLGVRNGSLGEVNMLAVLLGGVYLLLRKSASWRIPVGMLATVLVLGILSSPTESPLEYGLFYLSNGAVLFGAFFIATDPVTSPITPRGQLYFGVGVGALTMLIRLFSGYPEGVMFAVLVMNALVPILNNTTIPKAFGTGEKA